MQELASIMFDIVDSALSRSDFVDKQRVYDLLEKAYRIQPQEISENFDLFHKIIKQLYGNRHSEIDILMIQILHERTKTGKYNRNKEIDAFILMTNVFMREIKKNMKENNELANSKKHTKCIEEIMLANEKLRYTDRLEAISKTAAMIGHDIRNPLQVIVGNLYLLNAEISSLQERKKKQCMQESINNIQDSLIYIDKIVTDLQDYSKTLTPHKDNVNMEKVIEQVMLLVSIPDNLEVFIDVDKDSSEFISDFSMIKRILSNLINNAVQAMSNGGKLSIKTYQQNNQILVVVEDTGVGIAEEIRSKLFIPLFTTKSKGQGLGLAVVKRLVDSLNGTITFESEVNKGTKVIVSLPAK